MRPRNVSLNPEVTPHDLESPYNPNKVYGGGRPIQPGMPNIQPFQSQGGGGGAVGGGGGKGSNSDSAESMKKYAAIAAAVWLGGWFLGYEMLWPVYLVLDLLYLLLETPPFSWLFGWLWGPISWVSSFFYRGAPVVAQNMQQMQELRLPNDQVPVYLESYVQQYGDAALIFASHDGYPQIVQGLLFAQEDMPYQELIDAADENGNTALIYSSAKGFQKCVALLLRAGADPDVANQGGGGRTPLMEAAGAGNKDIVAGLRLANATLDMVDSYGNTALHYAAYHGHYSTVVELVKGNARKDITNSYGHTPASYAASNRHKAISDYLNRAPTKRERAQAAQQAAHQEAGGEEQLDFASLLAKQRLAAQQKEEKHVKGKAEELHKGETDDFAPKFEKLVKMLSGAGASDSSAKPENPHTDAADAKAADEQVAKLKRQHEEAELKAQKKIVELLEKSSTQQKQIDDAERATRDLQFNNTELQMRLKEFEMRHQASEDRSESEKRRADLLQEEMDRIKQDIDRHRSRADIAERERDLHMDVAKRHEDSVRQKQDEIREHVSRLDKQSSELARVREQLRQKELEVERHKDRITELSRTATSHAAEVVAPRVVERRDEPIERRPEISRAAVEQPPSPPLGIAASEAGAAHQGRAVDDLTIAARAVDDLTVAASAGGSRQPTNSELPAYSGTPAEALLPSGSSGEAGMQKSSERSSSEALEARPEV